MSAGTLQVLAVTICGMPQITSEINRAQLVIGDSWPANANAPMLTTKLEQIPQAISRGNSITMTLTPADLKEAMRESIALQRVEYAEGWPSWLKASVLKRAQVREH